MHNSCCLLWNMSRLWNQIASFGKVNKFFINEHYAWMFRWFLKLDFCGLEFLDTSSRYYYLGTLLFIHTQYTQHILHTYLRMLKLLRRVDSHHISRDLKECIDMGNCKHSDITCFLKRERANLPELGNNIFSTYCKVTLATLTQDTTHPVLFIYHLRQVSFSQKSKLFIILYSTKRIF